MSSSVQSLSRVHLFATTWTAAYQASLSITNYWSLLKFMSIESVMPSNHLIFCCPLLLPSMFPRIRVFSFLFYFFNFTILYWFCHISTWIRHRYTCVPHPEPSSLPVHESVLRIRWPKCWSFSFSISPSNEYSGLISFRMDWLDLLAVKGFSRVFSNTTVQKHQFFHTQLSLWSNSHIHMWLLEKP